jgi:tRNA threonylcarbamoyladenosine biosynthesis protein TsaE
LGKSRTKHSIEIMTAKITLEIADESETDKLGEKLAEVLPAAAVVTLIGPLGAGKTRLVRAICRAGGVPDGVVSSPTFVLVHEYSGRLPIYHFDAYRLRNQDEFLALGPEEYFTSNGWSLIEWADRVTECLPEERLEIEIEPTASDARRFTIRAIGPRYADVVDKLKQLWNTTDP